MTEQDMNNNWQGYDPYKGMTDEECMTAGCLHGAALIITFIVAMLLCALLSSCTTTKYVPITEHHTDTLRLVQHHRDSIYLHDSTFVREYIQGDTVRIVTEMWHTKYRDRLKTDTLYRSRTDSVPVPYPVIKEVKKPLTMIEKGLMGTGIGSIVGLLFYFFILFKKRLP
jgi:hypothetical protein